MPLFKKSDQEKVQEAVVQMEKSLEGHEMQQIFASYHFQTTDFKFSGFGNIVSKFYPEVYKGDVAKFIVDLEKSIAMALETLHKNKFEVKVLFFR
jgi:hypothetical protein